MASSDPDLGRLAILDELDDRTLFRLIVESTASGIVVTDADGRIGMVNSAAAELFGWDAADLLGRPVEELVPEAHREAHRRQRSDYVERPAVRPMGEGRLLEGLRADGASFIVEVGLSPIVLDGSVHAVATVRDITDRVDAEALARREEAWRAVLQDRSRIARDLHDGVIQELFAAGLTLANVASASGDDATRTLEGVIERLDDSIRRLRSAVFQLHPRGPRQDLRRIVEDAASVLGFEPDLVITGDPSSLDPALRADVESVMRECLSNIAHHARASSASIHVTISDGEVSVQVVDDGVGIGSERPSSGMGLRSLEERAVHRGGEARFHPSPEGGTSVLWRVPRCSDDV